VNAIPFVIRRGLTWFFVVSLPSLVTAAESARDPAGHWEGAITLPATSLSVRVDLERGGDQSWQGAIDIPVQRLRGFKLSAVKVDGRRILFAMPGIPGDPEFVGRLAPGDRTMAGDFTQGGQKFLFQLERKARPAAVASETPSRDFPGHGLAGHWPGSLKVTPVIELRLALNLTNSASGKPAGVMISLDQGNAPVLITTLTEQAGTVHFETKSISGVSLT